MDSGSAMPRKPRGTSRSSDSASHSNSKQASSTPPPSIPSSWPSEKKVVQPEERARDDGEAITSTTTTRTPLSEDELIIVDRVRKYAAYHYAVEMHKRTAWAKECEARGGKPVNMRDVESDSLHHGRNKGNANSLLEHAAVKRHDLAKKPNDKTVSDSAKDLGLRLSPTQTADLKAELESDERIHDLLENVGRTWKWKG